MTDDEAFIRAIVDRPGDDLPRLVYADWLDERGDPRGEYLRAEMAWAKVPIHGDEEDIIKLAIGLDPVWVARVSRPPVGVCCDHLIFDDTGPQMRSDGLVQFERHVGVHLPDEYRAMLLNYNGGIPDPNWLECYGGGVDEESWIYVTAFRSAIPRHIPETTVKRVEIRSWRTGYGATRKYLTFADVSIDRDLPAGILVLGLSGDQTGRVFHQYGPPKQPFNPARLNEVSYSLASMLSTITENSDEYRA